MRTLYLSFLVFLFFFSSSSEAFIVENFLATSKLHSSIVKKITPQLASNRHHSDGGIPISEILYLGQSFKEIFSGLKRPAINGFINQFIAHNNVYDEGAKEKSLYGDILSGYEETDIETFAKESEYEKRVVAKEFTIKTTVYQAIVSQKETNELVKMFVDIFAWDINFYFDSKKKDKIRMLYEKYYKNDKFIRYGKILAAQYKGINKSQSAFLYNNGGQKEYFDEEGNLVRKMFLKLPVKFGNITSPFSFRRFHPIAKKYKRHTGIDYGAAQGSPIFATARATVKFSGWKTGYGKLVILDHKNYYSTYYGHCSELLVKKGQDVMQGQIIAKVGQTGYTTGPHVHYEVRIKGKPIDPQKLKVAKEKPLNSEYYSDFKNTMGLRLAAMDNINSETTPPKKRIAAVNPVKLNLLTVVKAFFF